MNGELAHGGSPLDTSPPPQSGVLVRDKAASTHRRRWETAAGLNDLAQANARVEAQDFVVEAVETGLALGDQ
ncbi:hypothetical protein [Bradyrhizobium valentinum]|uniref:hypothetical protein n=1 Tax=Bradyrhizobium valentinum TaxID=1518501 RepID=UPI001FD8D1FE|nr:hypothetical protein [Bradyrhizobium valentinum]